MRYSGVEVFEFTQDTYLPKAPPPFLVDGLIHRSQTLIFGQTIAGKSMFGLSLAVAVASGQAEVFGRTISTAGPVAIVSGDPDGKHENYERLDRVRDQIGDGHIRLVLPDRPMRPETWSHVERATEGCSLMILDNLTQFVPGSLNSDDAVKLVYEQLDMLARNGMAVCTLAHASDKRDMHGNPTNLPMGSSVIRTSPRWFIRAHRADGVLKLSMSGNCSRPWGLELTEPTDRPEFDVLKIITPDDKAAQTERSRRQRKTETRDRNEEIRSYVLTECKGLNGKETALMLKGKFGGTASTHETKLSRGDYGLKRLTDGSWQRGLHAV